MSKYLLLESANRVSGDYSKFQLRLHAPLQGRYRLRSVAMPISFYNINGSNNVLNFDDDGTPHTITITEGFYSASTLRTALETALNAVSLNTWTVGFSTITGKYTFASSTATTFTFQFSTTANSLANALGFESTVDYPSTGSPPALVGTKVAVLGRPLALHFRLSGVHSQVDDVQGASFTFVMPLMANSGESVQVYEPEYEVLIEFERPQMVLGVTVTDHDERPIGLQSEWYMLLEKCGSSDDYP